jgi:hypothetical protein
MYNKNFVIDTLKTGAEKEVEIKSLVQWSKLPLFKGPNWVGVFPPPSLEDGIRSSFRNVVFSSL